MITFRKSFIWKKNARATVTHHNYQNDHFQKKFHLEKKAWATETHLYSDLLFVFV